jgi:hypothetical protein
VTEDDLKARFKQAFDHIQPVANDDPKH